MSTNNKRRRIRGEEGMEENERKAEEVEKKVPGGDKEEYRCEMLKRCLAELMNKCVAFYM